MNWQFCYKNVALINKAFHYIQGAVPNKSTSNYKLYVTTFYYNIDNKALVQNICTKVDAVHTDYLTNIIKGA